MKGRTNPVTALDAAMTLWFHFVAHSLGASSSIVRRQRWMNLERTEKSLGIRFPERHRRAMLDHGDPVHALCDFLLPHRTEKMRTIREENRSLHSRKHPDRWSAYLIAFASNGCGDFFAYDIRNRPYSIIYIDPDHTVQENLEADDSLTFATFEDWY
jgi:hypothetical protein